jgi:hypothetical protein
VTAGWINARFGKGTQKDRRSRRNGRMSVEKCFKMKQREEERGSGRIIRRVNKRDRRAI